MRTELVRLVASGLLLVIQLPGLGFAAGLHPHHPSNTDNHHARPFSFLTKLRDSAVELLFGRHPTRNADQHIVPSSARAWYTNELVLRFNVTTSEEEIALAHAAARLFLDVWAFTDEFVDIRMHRDEVSPLLSLLPPSLRVAQSTMISDLASAVYDSMPFLHHEAVIRTDEALSASTSPFPEASGNLFFQDYQPLPVIVRWMRLLEAMFPSHVEYVSIGASFEEREISALRVGLPPNVDPTKPRKTIVVTGGLHAREWISTSTVNYVAWSFITSFGKERMITKLLQEFDMVFVPVLNPDGVEYSWQVDRLWRKSRQQTNLRYCRGLDLDHAFGYEWDGSQMQADPCSEGYGGEQPFQAVEAMQLASWARNETLNNNVKFVGLIDLHSYSQQILFPYAFSCQAMPPNLEKLEELAAGIAKAIRLADGESYSVMSACEGATARQDQSTSRIESGGGSAIDWFYHELGAHFSYQIKLRDTGTYGFLLPKEYIVPSGEEVFSAMKYYGDYLLGNNGIERFSEETASPGDQPESAAYDDVPLSQELKRRRLRR
ncbi:zinc carboxypeptidase [Metarhizium album ARSEF 1941]|uniref:Inactive metallocarboxypeptidase ECM14 n=1 Tax=Metarhizium album (strain ARSEF 1941) TaxID=1081103 RepID=A0A0B2X3I6_METAS|nr:zinc carboxypeptidase [Metarhizium album ARSEF 1941]KHO00909.1 zinc carboxypeptidase [Metarhizium album ARSEF 1941]